MKSGKLDANILTGTNFGWKCLYFLLELIENIPIKINGFQWSD